MATATERWSDRRLTKAADGWTAERAWDVISAASETAALAASGIPAINDAHPDQSRMKVRSLPVERVGFNVYIVRAIYEIPTDGSEHGGRGTQTDPLDEPQRLRWRIGTETVEVDRDVDGNAILNSAGDPFASKPSRRITTIGLVVTRNEPFFDVQKAYTYTNKVNSNAFTISGAGGVKAGEAYIVAIEPTHDYAAEAAFVNVAYEFEFRPGTDPFQLKIIDQGLRAWYTDGTEKTGVMYTDKGEEITSDELLNGDGTPIDATIKIGSQAGYTAAPQSPPVGATVLTASGGLAKLLQYTNYESIDFDGLNL